MKLYNTKTGRTMEGTAIMLKSLAAKGWIEVKEEQPVDLNNEIVDLIDREEQELIDNGVANNEQELIGNTVTPEVEAPEESKPQAEPVKQSKAKTKNKK